MRSAGSPGCSTAGTAVLQDAHEGIVRQGAYLTDGTSLYRVVEPLFWHVEAAGALLENCRTLKVAEYTPEQLWGMSLRLVRTDGQAG